MSEHTFLFADLAGFTALTEAHGDEQAADLAAEFRQCVDRLLPEYRAEEIKTLGDAVMVRCDDPRTAIQLGVRIVDEVAALPHFPIVRVGMHTGHATEREGDWYGAAVNLAARVTGAAAGNEALLTEATGDAAGELDGIELHRHGQHRFKNVGEPVSLLRAVRAGGEAGALPIDPVCRMAVDAGTAAGELTHAGTRYQFCSIECLRKFADDPARYVANA